MSERSRLRLTVKNSVSLLIGVSVAVTSLSCASSPQVNSRMSGPAPGTESMSDAGANLSETDQLILQNEKQVWEAFKSKDTGVLDKLLADDIQVVTGDGRFNKADFVQMISQMPEIPSYSINRAKVAWPSKEVAILTYEASYTVSDTGPRPYLSYQTTVWVNRAGRWVAVFNQETQLLPRYGMPTQGERPSQPRQ